MLDENEHDLWLTLETETVMVSSSGGMNLVGGLSEVVATGERAGFRERAAATLIDALLVHGLCRALETGALAALVYLPFESTYAVLWVAYSVLGLAWKGATVGKCAVGLRVCTVSHGRVGLARAALRESVGKTMSALPLFAGFLAAARAHGRSWHDRMEGTIVVRVRHGPATRLAVVAGLGAGALIAGIWLAGWTALVVEALPMVPRDRTASPRSARGTGEPSEIVLVERADEAGCLTWVEEHGLPPAEFLLEQCRRYQVVIVGERHWERESLAFLCEQLPELHRYGVRLLAMEWLLAEDDELVERLVTAQVYDPELALEIARHHPWRTWGWKGYVDVLESAWRLNVTLPPGEAKLRVVGLDLPIDLVSMALAGVGDQAVDGPGWERLRAVRMLRELPRAILRECFMARRVEREILERGARALVWVGAAHSTIHCPGPGQGTGMGRMGFLLARRHPGAITQVVLHDAFGHGPPGSSPENGVSAFVERVMERLGNRPLGWQVTGSPFAALRDPHHWSFAGDAGMSFGDLACNYLFLAPRSRLARCDWLPGYVTARMLAENRPFYAAIGRRTGVEVRDAPSADLALSRQ